jgi:ATP-dependent Zn protease
VPLPDERGRQEILGVHLRDVPLGDADERADVCARLARATPGAALQHGSKRPLTVRLMRAAHV